MVTPRFPHSLTAVLIGAALAVSTNAIAQSNRFDELANLPFKENRPTEQTAQTLSDELLFQRATQPALDFSWKPGDIKRLK